MDDSRDTLIVTGCTGMTGKQFIETMLVFGKLKINDDGSNMSRILPEKGIGIVTFEKPEMAETARGMLNGQEIHGNTLTVLTAAEFFKTAKPLKGTNDRYGINMAWQMWNNNIENAGGKGGKGGSGFLGGMLKGQDGKPGQPGPNGKGGEGGKGGLGFFSGWLTGRNGKDCDGVTSGKGENGSFGKGKDGTDWGDGNRESMGCGKGGKGGFGKGKDGQSWRGNADQDKCESGGKKPKFAEHGSDEAEGDRKQNRSGNGQNGCSIDDRETNSNVGGAGGKGGAGLFGWFKGKDGQPGSPGPNGQGGKGG
ncbi:uncharacterized PE-PGRS family protein PE_PGRS20-like isoform X2 [Dreissena polymorpha]|uniref:RRM domain-containing protein n=3 Tax=Dreissena polymorpha TaxID=45954 RepID=A0A9D4FSN7_DREPO|nr:uncharacterized PE-PGRS family protein PE_PGRS20-like isoform X2 [Dreissena polymorpha]XP_052222281.1 uncharacterized PE-PGRS family protein PE_PGRS20-like isoform X2 [Dreissena polymorpha]XP_052222282.1 uncharacterized PE-PGRS family protein PE_PGRS20-like isoform X2 [Dreissena polymorpha]KAH3802934.1 hypothetical protein DPMN_156632 [Dreissena polymorpha]